MNVILDALAERGSMTVDRLAVTAGASRATIRRDLAALAERGLLVRTHGRASAAASAERPEALRDARFSDAKRRIARHAVALLPPGALALAIGGGTTTAEVARELPDRAGLTVITNSLTIAGIASSHAGCAVLMTGGRLRPQSYELVGSLAERSFEAAHATIAVLGADGVSAAGGVSTHDTAEARTNHAMVATARWTILVADGSKVGRVSGAPIARAAEVDVLVTDAAADAEEIARLRSAGMHVVVA
ncbi:DeoR/GlpR family DNA-binding transcription regulator [Microbacterium sp. RD1]|uniref:DeoR/GlpR family DNA-binding transcription regulator n=1 Tax=Microbacterium sp. RD1 TaxID=3457313 RepID=UPI003FA59CE0